MSEFIYDPHVWVEVTVCIRHKELGLFAVAVPSPSGLVSDLSFIVDQFSGSVSEQLRDQLNEIGLGRSIRVAKWMHNSLTQHYLYFIEWEDVNLTKLRNEIIGRFGDKPRISLLNVQSTLDCAKSAIMQTERGKDARVLAAQYVSTKLGSFVFMANVIERPLPKSRIIYLTLYAYECFLKASRFVSWFVDVSWPRPKQEGYDFKLSVLVVVNFEGNPYVLWDGVKSGILDGIPVSASKRDPDRTIDQVRAVLEPLGLGRVSFVARFGILYVVELPYWRINHTKFKTTSLNLFPMWQFLDKSVVVLHPTKSGKERIFNELRVHPTQTPREDCILPADSKVGSILRAPELVLLGYRLIGQWWSGEAALSP